ncbi:unnamed protein product [Trypanosoma congolense IL3000]|uniref:WGS project CAEQ00000000 data, annotated contig 477 n=1 Tax=Trypanosoma congolense (strain IL3000) TaxID=1068625 RepID=F9WG88_TRYCI|nr:unnamed protein product [Trypanosoma congolense IL3000]
MGGGRHRTNFGVASIQWRKTSREYPPLWKALEWSMEPSKKEPPETTSSRSVTTKSTIQKRTGRSQRNLQDSSATHQHSEPKLHPHTRLRAIPFPIPLKRKPAPGSFHPSAASGPPSQTEITLLSARSLLGPAFHLIDSLCPHPSSLPIPPTS